MIEFFVFLLFGALLAMWGVWRIMARVGRGARSVLTGGLMTGRRKSRFSVWFLRLAVTLVGAITWAASNLLRPLLVALVLLYLVRAGRRLQRFLAGAETLWDALLFRDLTQGLQTTFETFPNTMYTDPRGREYLPKVSAWRWVVDLEGERFGLQADIKAARGSSLGQIDDLTAAPGDKDEKLASTLNDVLGDLHTVLGLLGRYPTFASIDVQTTLERLQGLKAGEMPQVTSGHGVITLMERDPLWKHVLLPMPMWSEPWERVPLPVTLGLGVDRWGQDIEARLERWRLMAKSGWGKSVLLDTIIAQLVQLPADRVVVILIDCKWGMHHAKWERAVDWLVVRPEDATEAIKAVYDVMESRATAMKAENLEKLAEATPELPLIVLITDEAQELPWDKSGKELLAMNYLEKIYQKGRALGVCPVTTFQYGTTKEIPRAIAINTELDIAGKLRDRAAANVAMGDKVDNNFGPHLIPDIEANKGVFAIGTENGFGTYMRAYFTRPEDKLTIVGWAVEHNPRQQWSWLPEHETVADVIVLTPDEEAALLQLGQTLLIDIDLDEVDLGLLPTWLDKAKRRSKPAEYKALSKQLQRLIAA